MTDSKLLSAVDMQGLKMANRVALAPLTRARATLDHVPTEMMIDYYVQRASAGMIISEGSGISAQGMGWYGAPGIWTDEMRAGWKKIVDAVHEADGVILMQLWHMGRQAHSDVTGEPIVSASDVKLPSKITARNKEKKDAETPVALTHDGIKEVVAAYKRAAQSAKDAGFDGVELHSANGYLLDQFLQTCTNKRTDEYGGSVENRMRLLMEVLDAVTAVFPAGRVGVRLAPNGKFGDMGSPDNVETFSAVVKAVGERQVGYVHLLDGLGYGFHELCAPFTLRMARDILDTTAGAGKTLLMGNVGYTKDSAEERLQAGDADMIAFGRPFMSNPDLVERFRQNAPLNPEAPQDTWWNHDFGSKGYLDWPTLKEVAAKAS